MKTCKEIRIKKIKVYLYIFLKGALMGAADLIPGVSGGTMALMTGIYDRFINALASLRPSLLFMLYKQGVSNGLSVCWKRIDGTFLFFLALGILTSVFSLGYWVVYAMNKWEVQIWSFFMGLILVSCFVLIRQSFSGTIIQIVLLISGICLAISLSYLPELNYRTDSYVFFFGGVVAICAMLLPGISGSFILLIIGLYEPVLKALVDFELVHLTFFILGCFFGLICFSRFFAWMLSHYQNGTMIFLIGLMLGSLNILWPWKVMKDNVFPSTYYFITGKPAVVSYSVLFFVVGAMFIFVVHFLNTKRQHG